MFKPILFDIDGTLVLIPDAFCDVPVAGRSDAWILAETLAAHRLTSVAVATGAYDVDT